MTASAWVGLRIDPLDTFFFRDGRPFAPAGRAEGGLPTPQTLAGSLRTALLTRAGFDLGALANRRRQGQEVREALRELGAPAWVVEARFRGPWLALAINGRVDPLLPPPAVLARDGDSGQWYRSRPLPPNRLPGWPDSDTWPLWRAGSPDAKAPGGFLTPNGVTQFLAGGVPEDGQWKTAASLYQFDHRTGIGVDSDTLTAAEGLIYGVQLLALARNVCFYAEMLPGAGAPDLAAALLTPVALGGEGRHARITVVPACRWSEAPDGRHSLWLLSTPAPLADPRRPAVIEAPARVRAAAAGSPLAFSGWDVARGGPRPTRFAVPAGSTYFVEGEFSPPHGSFCSDAESAAQGWGMALRGVWNHD
jgi:CRISPR-associated protein Cmr3